MKDSRQSAVETGLRDAVTFAGVTPTTYDIHERMARYGVPGCAVAVIEGGEVAWVAGYGLTEVGGAAVTADTMFQAASISKVVNALAVLATVEQGLIQLDRDINEQLRSWQLPREDAWASRAVTPRQLLSHTAGTSTPGFVGYVPGEAIPTTWDILNGTSPANSEAVTVITEPTAEFHYSGGGTTILQLLLEDVHGEPYPEIIRRLVFEPLQMTSSHYQYPIDRSEFPQAACGHFISGERLPGGGNVKPTYAAGGMWSTACDLATLTRAVGALRFSDSRGLFSASMASTMLTAVAPGPHGLGPEIIGEGPALRFRHNGTNRGFCCQMEGLMNRPSGVVVMTNGDGGNSLLGEIIRGVASVYEWEGFNNPPIETVVVPEEFLARMEGHYVGPVGMELDLEVDGGEVFTPSPYGRRVLIPTGAKEFLDTETGAVVIVDDADDAVVARVLVDGEEILRYTKAD